MPATLSWNGIPTRTRDYIEQHFDSAWGRTSAQPRPFDAKAEQLASEGFIYSLRMYWLGRTDKLSSYALEPMAWITRQLVPAAILATEPEGPYTQVRRLGRVMFPDHNHHDLARQAVTTLLNAYAEGHGLHPVEPPKRSFWRRWT